MNSQIFFLSEMTTLALAPLAALISLMLAGDVHKIRLLSIGVLGTVLSSFAGLLAFFQNHAQSTQSELFSFDALSSTLLLAISFLSGVIVLFSERYLLGDSNRAAFILNVVLLSSTASLLVSSSNILMSVACWHVISLLLWRVISLRKEAAQAANTVLLYHLFSDVLMALAAIAIVLLTQHSDFAGIAANLSTLQKPVQLFEYALPFTWNAFVAFFLVFSMSVKSGLFPFHSWLLSTLEAPTPLSGFLHAGIVNVSAIMPARIFPLLLHEPSVLFFWGLWAGLAAFIGTLSMSAQSDVKRKLVYSTVGQMGFMCLQVASGFIPGAIFHLIAHGLFKCHMFLQSGNAVSEGTMKKKWYFGNSIIQSDSMVLYLVAGAVTLSSCFLVWQHQAEWMAGVSAFLATVLVFARLASAGRMGKKMTLLLFSSLALMAAFSCFVCEQLKFYVPVVLVPGAALLPTVLASFLLFSALIYLFKDSRMVRALYVHSLNGFYVASLSQQRRFSAQEKGAANTKCTAI